MRIAFVVRNIWGLGGTIKAALNTAAALADAGHQVTVVSCVRNRKQPLFEHDRRIEVVDLVDTRAPDQGGHRRLGLDRLAAGRPSPLGGDLDMEGAGSSALLDKRLARWLRRTDADAVVGTHPGVNRRLAAFARPETRLIAWEHAYLDRHKAAVRKRILADYPRFDAIVTGTEADALAYREALGGFKGTVAAIPNLVPAVEPGQGGADADGPVVMAAGRLVKEKGFDVLIRAFSKVADRRPEWRLRIYGKGGQKRELQQLIEDTRTEGRVELAGSPVPLDAEWGRAAVAVVPSRHESFGLTLVEAMSAGLPVIAADAPHGPREIIEPGQNGLLVEVGDVYAMAEALDRLMGDPGLRDKLAAAGRATAAGFEPSRVVGRWRDVLAGD
ncbi:glycosyltransferase family 4 protein [Glycomyces sp. A-F 0318]|uniref:glycosyltransferase family 4 protein n=1 Tax=Glycomyces amatae TaxID=2881355 RepID=UPI001E46306A|nr:glycosyltransferase family 4 protein [Glycomyces amatae]MCD0443735.1 glycosyltransferase family 4 protein [Glycomyces amatae]